MGADLWLPVVISSILSGSFVGGVVAFIKAGREKDRISVSAAEGALIVQTGVMKALQDENARLKEECEQISKRNERLVARVRELQGQEPKQHFD